MQRSWNETARDIEIILRVAEHEAVHSTSPTESPFWKRRGVAAGVYPRRSTSSRLVSEGMAQNESRTAQSDKSSMLRSRSREREGEAEDPIPPLQGEAVETNEGTPGCPTCKGGAAQQPLLHPEGGEACQSLQASNPPPNGSVGEKTQEDGIGALRFPTLRQPI